MKALEMSRDFFNSVALPALKRDFPLAEGRIAAGLVGNGSECFGYDDEQSRDHDWGIDFFLWIRNEDKDELLPPLSAWKERFMRQNSVEHIRKRSKYGAYIDVMTVGDFYSSLIGSPDRPASINDWRRAPEENYAMAVNGEVFYDPCGDFSAVRQRILGYYPEDLRLKRLAARCMAMAQTGQYNFMRMARREDWVTVSTTRDKFIYEAIYAVFILNRTFMPYYKWRRRRMAELPVLGKEVDELLEKLVKTCGFDEESLKTQSDIMMKICSLVADEMRSQWISASSDWFMSSHGEQAMSRIKDNFLRSLPPQFDF